MKKIGVKTAAMAAVLIGGMTAQANQVIDFTYVEGGFIPFGSGVMTTNAGRVTETAAFSDSTPLVTGSGGVNNSNQKIYGGVTTYWPEAQPDDHFLKLTTGNDGLKIQIKTTPDAATAPVGIRGFKGMFVWNKDDFLDHSGETVVFDANSSMSASGNRLGNMKFVVQDGTQYYVSQGNCNLDPLSGNWATIDTSNYSIGGYGSRTFTDVQAVGVYASMSTGTETSATQTFFTFNDFQVTAIPEPATLGMLGIFGGGLLFIRRRFML